MTFFLTRFVDWPANAISNVKKNKVTEKAFRRPAEEMKLKVITEVVADRFRAWEEANSILGLVKQLTF